MLNSFMKSQIIFRFLLVNFLIFFSLSLSIFSFACPSSNCNIPPFVGAGVKPNVVIMFDNSGSMKAPMYWDPALSGWRCSDGTHQDFDPRRTYYGLFDATKNYKYDFNIPVDTDAWLSNNPYHVTVKNVKGAFVEDNCNPITDDNCWSGNFLNWLVTRRADAARVALVGGKLESRRGYDYDGDAQKEWKILGNNEPSDGEFCKMYSESSKFSPFPDNTKFKIYSPANSGETKSEYDPYSKLRVQDTSLYNSAGDVIGEFGYVKVNSEWKTIRFSKEYTDPILVAGPPSYNGGDPSIIRIKEVTSSSFKIRIQEWSYLDGTHTNEKVFYLVLKRGVHILPGGKKIIADRKNISAYITQHGCSKGPDFQNISFIESFSQKPVVIASIIHSNENCLCTSNNSCEDDENNCHPVTIRLRNITKTQFEISLEEEEGSSDSGYHSSETVHFVAIEPGEIVFSNNAKLCVETVNNVTDNWKEISFCSSINNTNYFLAFMQTFNGPDTASLRYKNLSSKSVKIKVEEERSCDAETGHAGETVGYIAFESSVKKYNIALIVDNEPQGIIQKVAGKVRLGLTFYNYTKDSNIYNSETKDGGTFKIKIPQNPFVKDWDDVGGSITFSTHVKSDVSDLVNAIEHYPLVWGTTPLAENYYEVIRYFQQKNPYYSSSAFETNNDWDPYYYEEFGDKQKCAKSFVVVFTDGEPWRDCNIPMLSGCVGEGGTSCSSGPDCDLDGNEPRRQINGQTCYEGKAGGTDYLDDLSYWAYHHDLRDDIEGNQTITTYSVIFGISEQCSQQVNQVDCENAGCAWINNSCWPIAFKEQCRRAIMQDTATNGGGEFYYAADGAELAKVLTAILESIIRTGSAGAVATVTQQVLGEDIIVRGAFTTWDPRDPSTYTWQGHLEIYLPYEGCSSLNDNETCEHISGCYWTGTECVGKLYSFQLPENVGKFCSDPGFSGGHCWDAGELLKNQTSRTIFTFLDNTKKHLELLDNSLLEVDMDFDGNGSINDNDVEKLKNWIKGEEDGDGVHMRKRDGWILGDIVYSTPVVVGAPSPASVPQNTVGNCNCTCVEDGNINETCAHSCFYCYRYKYQFRDKVVYVGANDGMLHAFLVGERASDGTWVYEAGQDPDGDGHKIGEELWAYIPSNLLSELKCLAKPDYGTENGCRHRTMVDLSPEAWDVYIDHDNDGDREWRTVLIGGERGGGDVYFAIDVTDPDEPRILWEFSVLRNMVKIEGNQAYLPYFAENVYRQIKTIAASWSKPYVGRLNLGGAFYVVNKDGNLKKYDGNDLSGWFAFIGGGARVFNNSGELVEGDNGTAFYPHLLIIDIEKGVNIFQFIWPYLRNSIVDYIPQSGENKIPYVMADPLAIDLNNNGYIDRLYIGDLNGFFYGLKFDDSSNTNLNFYLDIWRTKKDSNPSHNSYRSNWQPITVQPVAALDYEGNLWLYFGTGKYNEVMGENDDKNDKSTMSFYALKDAGTPSFQSISCSVSGSGNFTIDCSSINEIEIHSCDSILNNCSWISSNGNPDCCENLCPSDCWTCVYDFIEKGERVVDSALVAGGLVFVTTFVPSNDPCASGGESYLYAFNYTCDLLDHNPFDGSGLKTNYLNEDNNWQEGAPSGEEKAKAYRVKLGSGMPSKPVLDSSGKYVLVQTSDAKIHRIKVKLLHKPFYLKGWKEK